MAGVGTLRRGLGRGTRIAPLFKGKVGLPSAGLIKPGAGLGKPGPPAVGLARDRLAADTYRERPRAPAHLGADCRGRGRC